MKSHRMTTAFFHGDTPSPTYGMDEEAEDEPPDHTGGGPEMGEMGSVRLTQLVDAISNGGNNSSKPLLRPMPENKEDSVREGTRYVGKKGIHRDGCVSMNG